MVVAALFFSGCAATTEPHSFPATWPASLAQPGESQTFNKGGESAPEALPTLGVEAFALDIGQPPPGQEAQGGIPTAQVLKDLLVQQLRTNGVAVSPESNGNSRPDYGLSCVVSRLGYTVRSGYPRQIEYSTELVCALRETKSNQVLWEQTLEQVFEHKVLVNTMTKLPVDPYAHEEMLIERCVLPVWDAMAERVKLSLKERGSISQAAVSEP